MAEDQKKCESKKPRKYFPLNSNKYEKKYEAKQDKEPPAVMVTVYIFDGSF